MAATTALAVFIIIRATRTEEAKPPPVQNTRTWRYVCPRKHKSILPLQEQPHECPICRVSAYPQADYECSIHGRKTASLRFEKKEDGRLVVSELRLPGQEWIPVAAGLNCPQCRLPLKRIADDPFDRRRPD